MREGPFSNSARNITPDRSFDQRSVPKEEEEEEEEGKSPLFSSAACIISAFFPPPLFLGKGKCKQVLMFIIRAMDHSDT